MIFYEFPSVISIADNRTLLLSVKVPKAIIGGRSVIPCRVTNPRANVTLSRIEGSLRLETGDNLVYDPQVGFVIPLVEASFKSGMYKCVANLDGDKSTKHAFIEVLRQSFI